VKIVSAYLIPSTVHSSRYLHKQCLNNSRQSKHQPQYLDIYNATRGILFLGTPHGGAKVANWGLLASNITKCALQSPSERVLRGLNPNSELLETLRKSFRQMLEDEHLSIHSFFETKPMMGVYGMNGLVRQLTYLTFLVEKLPCIDKSTGRTL